MNGLKRGKIHRGTGVRRPCETSRSVMLSKVKLRSHQKHFFAARLDPMESQYRDQWFARQEKFVVS